MDSRANVETMTVSSSGWVIIKGAGNLLTHNIYIYIYLNEIDSIHTLLHILQPS